MNKHKNPKIVCPECRKEQDIERVLTALSNQNVMYDCPFCQYHQHNIMTKKG
ncbi:hypothetical protein V1502_06375 [Bacillus sp. SCS-153A]|uniref:hypothetical protein n=1 Tax=Rossellomorea sedimentorum TaxID=3115294 RepID=UPI003905D561